MSDLSSGIPEESDPITDTCEPQCGCWESNSGPLKEQPLLLAAELSLSLTLFHLSNELLSFTDMYRGLSSHRWTVRL